MADEIAFFFQLGGDCTQMPYLRPQMLVLLRHPFIGNIAVGGNRIAANGLIKAGGIA